MITEKEIDEAAERYVEERKKCGLESVVALDEVDAAFIAGAEYAEGKAREECDAAFKWHKLDTNDPVQPKQFEPYLCYDIYGYFVAHMEGDEWFSDNEGNKEYPVAWCIFYPCT